MKTLKQLKEVKYNMHHVYAKIYKHSLIFTLFWGDKGKIVHKNIIQFPAEFILHRLANVFISS